MKKAFLIVMMTTFSLSLVAHADDFIPATSEDADQFDHQIAQHQGQASSTARPIKDGHSKKQKKDNFGQIVSAEAKKLKDLDQDKRKEFGAWVSDQRQMSDQQGHDATSSSGSGKDSSNAGGVSSSLPSASDRSNGNSDHGKGSSH